MVISPDCSSLIRTIPTLIQDKKTPDDCAGNQFAANALRFLLTSRPMPSKKFIPTPPPEYLTVGWLKSLDEKPTKGVLARES